MTDASQKLGLAKFTLSVFISNQNPSWLGLLTDQPNKNSFLKARRSLHSVQFSIVTASYPPFLNNYLGKSFYLFVLLQPCLTPFVLDFLPLGLLNAGQKPYAAEQLTNAQLFL